MFKTLPHLTILLGSGSPVLWWLFNARASLRNMDFKTSSKKLLAFSTQACETILCQARWPKTPKVNWIIQSWPMTWCFKQPPKHQTSKIQLPTSENQTCPKPRGNKNQGHHQRSHASETLSVASWLPISRKYQISSDIPSSESLGFS